MEWRRVPWIAVDMKGTKHQRQTWKGWWVPWIVVSPLGNQAPEATKHPLGKERTEPLGKERTEPQATGSPLAPVRRSSWMAKASRREEGRRWLSYLGFGEAIGDEQDWGFED